MLGSEQQVPHITLLRQPQQHSRTTSPCFSTSKLELGVSAWLPDAEVCWRVPGYSLLTLCHRSQVHNLHSQWWGSEFLGEQSGLPLPALPA